MSTGPSPPAPSGGSRTNRSGRNLPVAIGVGVSLAALVVATLYTVPEFFVALVILALSLAIHEVGTALRGAQIQVPIAPLIAGGGFMLIAGYSSGTDALTIAAVLTVAAVCASRLAEPKGAGMLRDVAVSTFVVVYLPLLAAFAVVMVAEPNGPDRVVVFILAVVLSDTGGYAAGVLFGRHRMSPVVSPKKSWEGLAGSVTLAAIGTAVSVSVLLGEPWPVGALLGCVVVVSATLGDLAESLIKRDLGIKDMGRLLPEHGGLMDRLDSLLPTAPVVMAFFAVTLS